ncbi:hypothetical protein BH09VER1_BH09VER1_56050 [soil metagenome]
MSSNLDPSHLTLLENYSTFLDAKQADSEIGIYLKELIQDLAARLGKSSGLSHSFALTWTDNEQYLQCTLLDEIASQPFQLAIGIEQLHLRNLLALKGAQGAQAYVFSNLLNQTPVDLLPTPFSQKARSLPAPAGFRSDLLPSQGYLFLQELPPADPQTAYSREALLAYLANPLETLIAWVKSNQKSIAALTSE